MKSNPLNLKANQRHCKITQTKNLSQTADPDPRESRQVDIEISATIIIPHMPLCKTLRKCVRVRLDCYVHRTHLNSGSIPIPQSPPNFNILIYPLFLYVCQAVKINISMSRYSEISEEDCSSFLPATPNGAKNPTTSRKLADHVHFVKEYVQNTHNSQSSTCT